MRFYKVSEDALRSLMEDAAFLESLRIAGVDNWSGYEHAQDIFQDNFDEDKIPYEPI